MTLFRFGYFQLAACAAIALCAASAQAAVYGKVEGDRVSVLYSDVPPLDRSYKLYSNSNRMVIHPDAWRDPHLRAQAQRAAQREARHQARTQVALGWLRHPGAAPVPLPPPSTYDQHITAAAHANKVDPALIKAVISVESGYNPFARSHAGAVGLMQLMPKTALRYGVTNSLDPAQNIHGGARYLRDLQAMFGNDLRLVLAAYNAGEEAVIKYGRRIPPFRETIEYVPKVLSHYARNRARQGGSGE